MQVLCIIGIICGESGDSMGTMDHTPTNKILTGHLPRFFEPWWDSSVGFQTVQTATRFWQRWTSCEGAAQCMLHRPDVFDRNPWFLVPHTERSWSTSKCIVANDVFPAKAAQFEWRWDTQNSFSGTYPGGRHAGNCSFIHLSGHFHIPITLHQTKVVKPCIIVVWICLYLLYATKYIHSLNQDPVHN